MPKLDGWSAIRELQNRAETAMIPILVLTATRVTIEDRVKLNGNVTTIMEKANFGRDRFTAEVRRAMSGRQSVGA